ncbi:hypothetical protein F5984_13085 [Rudanella paleaurantiibacter]|uniref:Uncharacterized protein n=1 Tax=Rudanella paleaurantiibacter TaxID=2614655 RepID=A0A7J5TYG7_9BACT|nr:hypothetical protein [Rudanella paleaurantiibacter]KAB7730111.1 hypothetical protein F5984_13085 [Rudanella paleaurantiibacter]
MKFFLPAASDEEQAERVYGQIKEFVRSQGHQISDARIYSITFNRNGRTETDTVGEIAPSNGEHVVAIFNAKDLYLVCTYSRGVAMGGPMLTGAYQIQQLVLFDSPEPEAAPHNGSQ